MFEVASLACELGRTRLAAMTFCKTVDAETFFPDHLIAFVDVVADKGRATEETVTFLAYAAFEGRLGSWRL